MEIIYIIVAIVQSIAVSLGVGGSTVAITQFFAAISDGKIDESERRVMGVVYIILRVAMGLILITTLAQAAILYQYAGMEYFNPFTVGLWVVVAVLFLNAIGMTKRWIPSTFGPAIQAGSWYTLGLMLSLVPLGLLGFTYLQFSLVYAGIIVLAIAIVNVVMNQMKK